MTLVKLSDWVTQKVTELGIRHVFMVTGGGAMHLNHSLGSHPDLECIFNHHEQACAIGAEAYYRLNNKLALVNVTSGPGGTNAITGVYGAFVDSIGMVVLSGQVKFETTVRSTGLPLRQYGDQELDIEELVRPITKYCHMITDPDTVRYHIEKAFYLATAGRPGPCWLDIPLNVQAAKIDPSKLKGFDPAEIDQPWKKSSLDVIAKQILEKIVSASRPVVLVGSGVRLSGAHDAFLRLVEKLGIPVVTAWNAHDAIWDDHPLYCGRPGTIGNRGGNFVTQNADLLLILGSRLNIRQVSYNWPSFARAAYKVWVDIDEIELRKPTVIPDFPVHADLAELIPKLISAPYPGPTPNHRNWLKWARGCNASFPTVLPEYWDQTEVNPYCFIQRLFEHLPDDANIVTGNGSACVVSFQAGYLKKGQRIWTNSGCATMGYDLPASIGVHKASGGKPVICIAGDGSIMMNLQELQTIVGNNMPIKIFLLNNNGYVSIFQTHRNFFNGVEIGGGPKSGVSFPDFKRLCEGFGLQFIRCTRHSYIAESVRATIESNGPAVCEVMLDEHQPFAPKLGAKQLPDGRIISPPLEDLSPFLSREEFEKYMLIPVVSED